MRSQQDSAGGLRHLVTLEGLTRDMLTAILDRAETYRRLSGQPAYEGRELAGVTVANLFFEPSTRTRASFDLAARRLGAHVLNLEQQASSRVKGETMLDTIYTLEAMNTDVFVIRDSEAGMPDFLIDHVAPHVSVISAGEAHVSHPTQGLLDALTIRTHKRRFAGLKVAIVGDIKQHHLEQASKMAVYAPFSQDPWAFFALVVRTKLEPLNAASAVKDAIHAVDPDEPVYNVRSMRDVEAASLSPQRLQIALIGFFAALALILSCMGIYGVMGYSVAQRTSEIGVRMALGAQTGNVLGLVLSEGLRLALLGAGIGLAGSFFAARLLSGMLFGVTPGDPMTFAGVAFVLVAVAMVACYIPARRATRVDPLVALRYE